MKYCLILCLLALLSNAHAADADVAARERYMKDFRSANKAIGRLLKANPADMAALSRQTADLQALADKPWPHYASGPFKTAGERMASSAKHPVGVEWPFRTQPVTTGVSTRSCPSL